MPIRIYRLSGAGTVTAVGVAATVSVSKGRIKQVSFVHGFVAGAGNGRMSAEVAVNNNTNGNAETASGAPSELLVARSSVSAWATGSGNQAFTVSCDVPINPGTIMCINQIAVGTAPAIHFIGADIYVQE